MQKQIYTLSATRIAEYFRFGCERQLLYDLAGPGVVGPERSLRPGARLLEAAGRGWERRKVRQLIHRIGDPESRVAGWQGDGRPSRLPVDRVVDILGDPGEVQILVQPEIRLRAPERFARAHGLDVERLQIAAAVPDLIRIRRRGDGRLSYQVVDIKASPAGRIPHFAQVAYYTLLLDAMLEEQGITAGRTDRRWGRVWARDGRGPVRFPLAAYRHHVAAFLRGDLPRTLEADPGACSWHLSTRCASCGYLGHCRVEADQRDDLARVVGITSTAKTVLAGAGITSVRALSQVTRSETFRGSHALESQGLRLTKRAMALAYRKVIDLDAHTYLMPAREDHRIVLSLEGDPVSGHCFALGFRLHSEIPLPRVTPRGVHIAAAGTRVAEREMLLKWLGDIERILLAVARSNREAIVGTATLHFYLYDQAEAKLLREMVGRHLADPVTRPAIERLLQVLSPRGISAKPSLFRSPMGTVLSEVLRSLFALPVPYSYDLAPVAERLPVGKVEPIPLSFAGLTQPFSNQIAFERIHEAWAGTRSSRDATRDEAAELRGEIHNAITAKLDAIDSVVRSVRERAAKRDGLRMRKEPFTLELEAVSLADPALDAMRVMTELEAAAEATALQALHALPTSERVRRLECIRGLSLVDRRADGTLVFDFDPSGRDTKFRPGDFNLVLTPDDERSLLDTDRQPWKRRALMMELVEFDLAGDRARLVLNPIGAFARAEAERWIDLDRLCVLDRAPADFGTRRILATLRALDTGQGQADAVRQLLRGRVPSGWPDRLADADAIASRVLGPSAAVTGRPVLNAEQELAWRKSLEECVTLIWGPPGTGKTYLLAWTLIGLAAAARAAGRPFRILVTAVTHRAIVNLLVRLSKELAAAGVPAPLKAVKLRGGGSEADDDLSGTSVDLVEDSDLPDLLASAEDDGIPLVVGGTVWSLWKQMRKANEGDGKVASGENPVASWFDAIVVDEASQMKVPEVLIAFSSARAGARFILGGDDRQLAPVVKARHGADHGSLPGSAFAHFAGHFRPHALRESRRMNEALIAYPRKLFYPGLASMVPDRRLLLDVRPIAPEDVELVEAFLQPEQAVVLCTYRGARSAARNVFEAALVARLAELLRDLALDPATGQRYTDEVFVAEGMAIISPHRAQNSAILAELAALGLAPSETPVVDTVERMQGAERELVILSYGVSDREYAEAESEFLLSPNRFNVATTRARSKLIVIMSEEVLEAIPADEVVMSGSMAIKGFPAYCRDGSREILLPAPDGTEIALRCRYRLLRD